MFHNPKELPDIVLGNHADEGFMQLNIPARKLNDEVTISVLIDPKDNSDKEILAILKSVQVEMVTYEKGKLHSISKPVYLVHN